MRLLLFVFLVFNFGTDCYAACSLRWDVLSLSGSYQSARGVSSCGIAVECRGAKGNETITGASEKTVCLAKSDTACIIMMTNGIQADVIRFRWEQEFSANVSAVLIINDTLSYRLETDNQQDISMLFEQSFVPNITLDKIEIRQLSSSSGQITIGSLQLGTPDISVDIPILTSFYYGMITVSELMIDPDPSVYLPDCEYIELVNTSESMVYLDAFVLAINNKSISLPHYELAPGACAVLHSGCLPSVDNFLSLALPVLSNESFTLSITAGGQLIYSMYFTAKLFARDIKSSGGWSIEKRDLSSKSNDDYLFSNDSRGGSPGSCVSASSVLCPLPTIISVHSLSENSLAIEFSHQIDSSFLHAGLIQANGVVADSISCNAPLYRELRAYFPFVFESKNMYRINVTDLQTFCGSSIESADATWAISERPEYGDIIFNEIMFDPLTNAAEYIELRNTSDKTVSLKDLQLGTCGANGILETVYSLSTSHYLLYPDSLILLCTDSSGLAASYLCSCTSAIYVAERLPALTNTGRSIELYNRSLVLIDQLAYSPGMHSASLVNSKGVSLELTAQGWSSSSSACGYGSPGCPNTELVLPQNSSDLCTDFFAPDRGDRLSILFDASPNSVADVILFSENGALVKQLADKMLVSGRTDLFWEGDNAKGSNAPAGIYIVWLCVWDEDGKKQTLKKPTVLLR